MCHTDAQNLQLTAQKSARNCTRATEFCTQAMLQKMSVQRQDEMRRRNCEGIEVMFVVAEFHTGKCKARRRPKFSRLSVVSVTVKLGAHYNSVN